MICDLSWSGRQTASLPPTAREVIFVETRAKRIPFHSRFPKSFPLVGKIAERPKLTIDFECGTLSSYLRIGRAGKRFFIVSVVDSRQIGRKRRSGLPRFWGGTHIPGISKWLHQLNRRLPSTISCAIPVDQCFEYRRVDHNPLAIALAKERGKKREVLLV
jgi:hypothetical protein